MEEKKEEIWTLDWTRLCGDTWHISLHSDRGLDQRETKQKTGHDKKNKREKKEGAL